MNKNTMIELYNRTYNNCLFYKQKEDNTALLNEIGVLRGIAYCLECVIGPDYSTLIDWKAFTELINIQNEMKKEK